MRKGLITLTDKELKRVKVLERLSGSRMNCKEAAETLGICERQLRRIVRKYETGGAEGIIHGNRGRKPTHALPETLKDKVTALYEGKYYDSNFTHYSELLAEREDIWLSASSVGRILKNSKHSSKRKKKRCPKKHQPRERRSQTGMLWQLDATPYSWLGRDVGVFALHAAIDDATEIVTGAYFTENECFEGYAKTMSMGIEAHGIPLGACSDKHTIFRSPNEKLSIDQELDGEQIPLSNFGKAMAELQVEHIKVNTPQAKGRIERLWQTLQDRLPVELRLLKVRTIQEANDVLPLLIAKHNASYAVAPMEEESAYMPLPSSINLEYVFSWRETRKIGGGYCISYKNGVYTPVDAGLPGVETRAAVEVRETVSGEVVIWHRGKAVLLRKLDRRPTAHTKDSAKASGERKSWKPAEDHPWKRGIASPNARNKSLKNNGYAAP